MKVRLTLLNTLCAALALAGGPLRAADSLPVADDRSGFRTHRRQGRTLAALESQIHHLTGFVCVC